MSRAPSALWCLLPLLAAGLAPAQGVAPAPAPAATGLASPDAQARIQAARAAGQRGDPAAFPELIAALKRSPEPEVQAAILAALEKLTLTPEQLIDVLAHDADPTARAFAAYTLGRMRASQAVPALTAALKDPDVAVRERAIAALGKLGDPRAFEALLRAAHSDPSPNLRARAEEEATRLSGTPSGFDEDSAIARLKSADPAVRREAANALGHGGSWWAVAPLIALLDDPAPEVRERAAAALGDLQDKRAAAPLAAHLPLRTGRERYLILASLSFIADDGARGVIEPYLTDPDAFCRRIAARALTQVGDAGATPALARAYRAEAIPENRQELVLALGKLASPAAIPTLVEALRPDESDGVRCEAARALARIPTAAAVDALLPFLSDQEPLVRAAAVDALATRADLGARADVRAQLQKMSRGDPDAYVQEAAIEALVLIDGRQRLSEQQRQSP